VEALSTEGADCVGEVVIGEPRLGPEVALVHVHKLLDLLLVELLVNVDVDVVVTNHVRFHELLGLLLPVLTPQPRRRVGALGFLLGNTTYAWVGTHFYRVIILAL